MVLRIMDETLRGRSIGCMAEGSATGCGDDQLLSRFTAAHE